MGTDSDTRLDCGGKGYTPGPWVAIVGDTGIMDSHIPYISIDDGQREIARVRLDRVGYLAKAHLMASAPELLTQLEYAVKLLGAFAALNGTAQVQSMRDTIAKARGQSPLPLDPSLSNKDEGGAS